MFLCLRWLAGVPFGCLQLCRGRLLLRIHEVHLRIVSCIWRIFTPASTPVALLLPRSLPEVVFIKPKTCTAASLFWSLATWNAKQNQLSKLSSPRREWMWRNDCFCWWQSLECWLSTLERIYIFRMFYLFFHFFCFKIYLVIFMIYKTIFIFECVFLLIANYLNYGRICNNHYYIFEASQWMALNSTNISNLSQHIN